MPCHGTQELSISRCEGRGDCSDPPRYYRRLNRWARSLGPPKYPTLALEISPPSHFVCVKLINRVQPKQLNTSQCIELRWRDNLVDFFFRVLCSLISVAERISHCVPVPIQTNIVDSPPVHANRRNSFGRCPRAQTQPIRNSVKNPADIPAKACLRGDGRVGKTMNHMNLRLALFPS